LEWQRELSRDVDLNMMGSVGSNTLNVGLGDQIAFELDTLPIYYRMELRGRLSRAVQIVGGLDLNVTPYDILYRGPQPGQSEGSTESDPLSLQESRSLISSGSVYRPAAYVETTLNPIEPLTLIMGLRLDWSRDVEEWSFDPRLAAAYQVSDATRLKAGIGLFSQPPEFQESAPQLGNPDL